MRGTAIFILPDYLQLDGITTVSATAKFAPGAEKKTVQRLREDVADEYSVEDELDLKFGCLFLHGENCEAITDWAEL